VFIDQSYNHGDDEQVAAAFFFCQAQQVKSLSGQSLTQDSNPIHNQPTMGNDGLGAWN